MDHHTSSTRGCDFDESVTRVGARQGQSLGELTPNGGLEKAGVETIPTGNECEATEDRVRGVSRVDLLEHPPHLVEGRRGPRHIRVDTAQHIRVGFFQEVRGEDTASHGEERAGPAVDDGIEGEHGIPVVPIHEIREETCDGVVVERRDVPSVD